MLNSEALNYCFTCEFKWFSTNVFPQPESEHGWADIGDQYV